MDRLIVTMSERGCKYFDQVFPVDRSIEVRDLSGAGDSWMKILCSKVSRSRRPI